MKCRLWLGLVLWTFWFSEAAAQGPAPVSPGGRADVPVVSDNCPTFLWTEAVNAVLKELADTEASLEQAMERWMELEEMQNGG